MENQALWCGLRTGQKDMYMYKYCVNGVPKSFLQKKEGFQLLSAQNSESVCEFDLFSMLVKEFEFSDSYGGVF